MLLAFGLTWLGIITPILQVAFANLYFRKGHIWSRVLNADLEKDSYENGSYLWANSFRILYHLLKGRILH